MSHGNTIELPVVVTVACPKCGKTEGIGVRYDLDTKYMFYCNNRHCRFEARIKGKHAWALNQMADLYLYEDHGDSES